MTSIFPTTAAGGLLVRGPTGGDLNPPGVENDYNPKPAYIMTDCPYYALPSDCTARIEPRQINAIVSELVALAECMDPNGPWDCTILTNLCRSFTTFRAAFTPASLISNDPDNVLVTGSDGKLFTSGYAGVPPKGNGLSITVEPPFAVIAPGTVSAICANVPARQSLCACLRSTDPGNWLAIGSGDLRLFSPPPPVRSVNGMIGDVILPISGGPGNGDVVGPASAVAGHIAVFYNNTGKVISDGGVALSALDPSNRVLRSGDTMSGALRLVFNSPTLVLEKTASGQAASIAGRVSVTGGWANRWIVQPGDSATESGGNNGSDFRISRYDDGGLLIDTPLLIRRVNGHVILSSNLTAPGTIWSTNDGLGALNGNTLGLAGTNPGVYLDKTANTGQNNILRGSTNLKPRWQVILGDNTTEAGSNTGSDFKIEAFSDSGARTTPVRIARNTGFAYFSGDVYFDGGTLTNFLKAGWIDLHAPASQHCQIDLHKAQPGIGNLIRGFTADKLRWQMQLGDTSAESGGNIGSNFLLGNYKDDGTFLSSVLQIRRNDNYMTFVGEAAKPGGGPWAATSDERIKNSLGSYNGGLKEILGLEPVRYTYKGNDPVTPPDNGETVPYPSSPHKHAAETGKEYIGLIAQAAELVMPEIVSKSSGYIDGTKVDDLRQIDTGPLIFALINAVKELSARVEQLEASR